VPLCPRLLLAVTVMGGACSQAAPIAAPPKQDGNPELPHREPIVTRLRDLVAGGAGVEIAGIAVAHIAADGTRSVAAAGCAHFDFGGRRCERALTPDTIVRVASISKMITAAAVLRLVEAGRLDLDRDVSDLLTGVITRPLRNPAFAQQPITLRQLLSHTSSLRDGTQYSIAAPGTLAKLLDAPDRFDPLHPPGAYFHYDNINYVVIGAVVEKTVGERFDTFMNREILRPAGVTASFGWAQLSSGELRRFGTLYRKRGVDEDVWQPDGPWIAQVDDPPIVSSPERYAPGSNPSLSSPHGGLRISAADLAELVSSLLGGATLATRPRRALISAASLLAMITPRFHASDGAQAGESELGFYRDFGLGTHSVEIDGRILHGHFGEAYGLKGGALFDPLRRDVWVYLITGYGGPPPKRTEGQPAVLPGLDVVEDAVVTALLR
jgi:CubicO group peptidase (beta-lactamase class C family)